MAEGKIIRKGGAGKQTAEPSITIVDNTTGDSVTYTLTNNDDNTAVLVHEIDDTTPDLYSVELATGATSSNIEIDGLSSDTSYTIYCYGTTAEKVQSIIASLGFTTPEIEIVYYESLGDIEVTGSAVTSVQFSGLNIGKTDDVVLLSNIYNPLTSVLYSIYVNNNQTATNYYNQRLFASSSTVGGARSSNSQFERTTTSLRSMNMAKIKLTNDGYFTVQAPSVTDYTDGANMLINIRYVTSTFTMTSITQLDIVSPDVDKIGIGSRFQLYKVVA